ncbi:MAG: YeeE/YedE family protein [Acidobacteria bacterium]|jgi:hypothetical protein|nr:YeeE/YedE family protein [Acidobacteriota bacterium]
MNLPLYKFGAFGDEASLVVAFVIGIGFGWFLERAGFGNARKLMAQFYLTDMAVFKVMFSAVVTALLGVTYLAWAGWLDLSLVYYVPTYWITAILGGLLMGVGFVIGGYCPGTSVASMATGRIDGLVYVAGFAAGTLGFVLGYPLFKELLAMGDLGVLTLPEVAGVRWGIVVFGVVLLAIGGFAGATWVEKWMAARAEPGASAE